MALLPKYLCHGGQVIGRQRQWRALGRSLLGASSAYMHEFTWSIFPVCLPNLTARLWGVERECHTKQDRGPGFLEAPHGGGGQNMQHSVRYKADGSRLMNVQTVQRDSRGRERLILTEGGGRKITQRSSSGFQKRKKELDW